MEGYPNGMCTNDIWPSTSDATSVMTAQTAIARTVFPEWSNEKIWEEFVKYAYKSSAYDNDRDPITGANQREGQGTTQTKEVVDRNLFNIPDTLYQSNEF